VVRGAFNGEIVELLEDEVLILQKPLFIFIFQYNYKLSLILSKSFNMFISTFTPKK